MDILTSRHIEMLRKCYLQGTKIRLINTSDPYTQLQPGSEGVVLNVDAVGTTHIQWDNGSILGMIPGENQIEIIANCGS